MVAEVVILLALHGPLGQEVDINAAEISSIRELNMVTERHFGEQVNCVVVMTNGKFIATQENCDAVRQAVRNLRKGRGANCTLTCKGVME